MSLPGTDAQLVRDLTASQATPLTSGTVIVVTREGRLDDGIRSGVLAATASSLQRAGHVTTVLPPAARAGSLSSDGRTGWFTVRLDVRRAELTKAMASTVTDSARPAADAGLLVLPGGAFAQVIDQSGSTGNEYFGLLLATLVLFLALGGIVGAAPALLTAAPRGARPPRGDTGGLAAGHRVVPGAQPHRRRRPRPTPAGRLSRRASSGGRKLACSSGPPRLR